MFQFGGKKIAKPSDLVKATKDGLIVIEKNSNNPKAAEKVSSFVF